MNLRHAHSLGKITAHDEKQMATIIAELVRQGVTFDAYEGTGGTWIIELTGGY